MQNLSIQLIINQKCQLISVDNTNYLSDNIIDYVSLEFLVYNEETGHREDTIVFKEYTYNREQYVKNTSAILFPKDGIFTYYKFVIPRLEKLQSGNIFNIKDRVFYYNGAFYFGLENTNNPTDAMYSTKIDNYLDI